MWLLHWGIGGSMQTMPGQAMGTWLHCFCHAVWLAVQADFDNGV